MSKKLEQRKEKKSKKPKFKRHDSHKNKKLSGSWRRPRGLQSKLRLGKRGYGRKVSTGWGSPKEVRGLHPSGLEPVNVSNVNDLAGLDKKSQGAVVSSRVGDRKRLAIIKEAKKKDIKILNFDADKYASRVEKRLKAQKEEREELEKKRKAAEKKAKKEEKEKEESEEDSSDEELSQEEKKKQEKKEKDKVLTKK